MAPVSCRVPTPDCLAWCTIEDGIHVVPTVNEVLVQQLANAFLVWVS